MASRYNSQTKNLEEVKAQILLDQMKFKQKENEYLKLIDHLNGQLQRQPAKKTKGKPSKGKVKSTLWCESAVFNPYITGFGGHYLLSAL